MILKCEACGRNVIVQDILTVLDFGRFTAVKVRSSEMCRCTKLPKSEADSSKPAEDEEG